MSRTYDTVVSYAKRRRKQQLAACQASSCNTATCEAHLLQLLRRDAALTADWLHMLGIASGCASVRTEAIHMETGCLRPMMLFHAWCISVRSGFSSFVSGDASLRVRRVAMAALATAAVAGGSEQERIVGRVLALKCRDRWVAMRAHSRDALKPTLACPADRSRLRSVHRKKGEVVSR